MDDKNEFQKSQLFQFWNEVKKPFILMSLITVTRFAIIIPLFIVFYRWIQCKGWWGYTEPVKSQACVDMAYPFLYWTRILADLPRVFLPGLMILLLGILYLEWDKYKKDKPHGFGVYGRRTAPNGGWMRSNFERIVTGRAWEKYGAAQLTRISDSENHLLGKFTDQEVIAMVKAVSKRFTSFLRKPTVDNDKCIEWHIHANSGEEVRLRLEQIADATQPWVLTACLYEWAGRRQPARLIQKHVTRFGLSTNVEISKVLSETRS